MICTRKKQIETNIFPPKNVTPTYLVETNMQVEIKGTRLEFRFHHNQPATQKNNTKITYPITFAIKKKGKKKTAVGVPKRFIMSVTYGIKLLEWKTVLCHYKMFFYLKALNSDREISLHPLSKALLHTCTTSRALHLTWSAGT